MSLPHAFERWILSIEGGRSDDPDDAGGLTRYGISKNAYPELDIENLTQAEALSIYARDYYYPSGADMMPPVLGLAVFDGAVHHDVPRSVRLLQKALTLLGHPGVQMDGLIGPVTLAAVEKEYRGRGADDVLAEYLAARARLYFERVVSKPSQGKFLRGWLRRLFLLEAAAWRRA